LVFQNAIDFNTREVPGLPSTHQTQTSPPPLTLIPLDNLSTSTRAGPRPALVGGIGRGPTPRAALTPPGAGT
jgi:hypothetical protein